MAMQNLVSATMSSEAKAEVLRCLADIKRNLAFLASIKAADVRSLVKAGNGYAPLLDKASVALDQHPEIMPAVFPIQEFRRDYQLYKDLAPIAAQVEELAESIEKTMIALASDTMVETLEIYHAVKQNADKVPGLSAIAADMQVFFARSRKAPASAKA